MALSSEFVYILGQGEDLRQPKDWHTVAQVNTRELGDSSMKHYSPVAALPEKKWERHKDIPHRFDEIKQPDWVEVKEAIKTQKEIEAELERSKPKPTTDSEDEVFVASKSKRNSLPNRPEYKKIRSLGNISESSSMDSVTNGMVAWGLGKVPSNNHYHNKFNRKKTIKKQEINFKGKFRENTENHQFYPKEIHPRALHIPRPDYNDEAEEFRSTSQKYYYEILLLEGKSETIPRPKLFKRHNKIISSEYNDAKTFRMDEMGQDGFKDKQYGNNYGDDNFEYHESEYIQEYEYDENKEYLDHDTEYGGKEIYHPSEYGGPYYETEYQENVEGYNEEDHIFN